MKFLLVLIVLLISGCGSVPVVPMFPDAPMSINSPCEELELLPENTDKISDVLVVVASNYSKYHVCKNKIDAWIIWYKEQKEIFNEIKVE